MTPEGSPEYDRLSKHPDWNEDLGDIVGDPLDIRDPRNINPGSPIEGATYESAGVISNPDQEVVDQPQSERASGDPRRANEPLVGDAAGCPEDS